MNRSRTSRIFILLFSFVGLLGMNSRLAIARDDARLGSLTSEQAGELRTVDAGDVYDVVAEPTPEVPELDNGEPFSISSTASITVTLGAWRNLRPTESYLRDVSLLPDTYEVDCASPDQKSKGWIVGDSGLILSYCNGVWDHAIVVESVPTDLNGVQAISPTLGVAVGEQGAVLMYLYDPIAGDWVWTKSPIPVGNQLLHSVSMVPDGSGGYTGWVVGAKDSSGRGTLVQGTITLVKGSDPKTYTYDWQNLTASFPDLPQVDYYYGLQMLSPTDGWAVGGTTDEKGVILHWDGAQWSVFQEIGTQIVFGLQMLSFNEGWAVGLDGSIYQYDGSIWSAVSSPTTAVLVDVAFASDDLGWAVGYDGTLVKYDHGSWSLFNDLRTDPFVFRALDFTSGHGWLVGFNDSKSIGGQILEYEDDLWLAVTPPTDNRLNDVAVVNDNDAWAVGTADSAGGTIIHWDGKHWQRWYQHDLPLPGVNLYTVDMVSATDGWAAGDPASSSEPAVFLRWDGHRWYQPRYEAPVNVRVNALALLDSDLGIDFGGWAAANNGNAVAKWDGVSEYWSANHACYGTYYNLRSASIVTSTNTFGWDAWAVGTSSPDSRGYEYFVRYTGGCGGSNAWIAYQSPSACLNDNGSLPNPDDGPWQTYLRGVQMMPGTWGFAVGDYKDRASTYYYDGSSWSRVWCERQDSTIRPSRLYAADIVEESGVGWFGGYYTSGNRKKAYLKYYDATGYHSGGTPFPINGRNIYHRPILSLDLASDTMGWAVGEGEDSSNIGVIYQYPYPNFTLGTSPQARAVLPGGSTFFTATVNSFGGFSADVSLSVDDLPEGITAEVNPGTVNVETTAKIDLTTSASSPLGVYEIPLRGSATFRSGDVDIPVSRATYLRLTVTNNPVYSVSPSSGPVSTTVTISGANFGPDPGVGNRSTSTNHVIWAGVQMPDTKVISWSNTQITFQPPDNPDLFLPAKFPLVGEVSVTAGGSDSNSDFTFQLENYLEDLSFQKAGEAITVTLTGTSLGDDPGALFRSTYFEHVSLSGSRIPNSDVLSWSNNAITFTVPISTTSGQVTVTSNGYESNSLLFEPSPASNKVYLPMVVQD